MSLMSQPICRSEPLALFELQGPKLREESQKALKVGGVEEAVEAVLDPNSNVGVAYFRPGFPQKRHAEGLKRLARCPSEAFEFDEVYVPTRGLYLDLSEFPKQIDRNLEFAGMLKTPGGKALRQHVDKVASQFVEATKQKPINSFGLDLSLTRRAKQKTDENATMEYHVDNPEINFAGVVLLQTIWGEGGTEFLLDQGKKPYVLKPGMVGVFRSGQSGPLHRGQRSRRLRLTCRAYMD